MSDTNREASATIRGYNYQFDSTILAILSLDESDSLTIEGLEDFDLERTDISELYQCKYYSAEKLTGSVIRDAILPMLIGFHQNDKQKGLTRQYYLYGYFKDAIKGERNLTIANLKDVLKRREKHKDCNGDNAYVSINIQEELGISDQDLVYRFGNSESFSLPGFTRR